jgi:hypothetical protein
MLLAQANQLWYSLPLVVSVSLVYARHGTKTCGRSSITRFALAAGSWLFWPD